MYMHVTQYRSMKQKNVNSSWPEQVQKELYQYGAQFSTTTLQIRTHTWSELTLMQQNPAQEDKEALSSLLIPCILWNSQAPHHVHHSLPPLLLLTLMKAAYPFTIHFKISPPSYISVFHVFHPFSFPHQIYVCIFGSKREKVTGSCRKLHSENFHDLYCSPNRGNETEQDEMGGVCCMYGKHEKCVEDFCVRTWRKETTWMTQA